MATRTRTRSAPLYGYDKQMFVGNVWTDGPVSAPGLIETCTDQTGSPHSDHTLAIDRYDATGFAGISGATTNPLYSGSYCQGVIPAQLYPIFNGNHGTYTVLDNGQAATRMQARSNPGRPGVTPLTLIQDLVDIPKMLRGVGKLARTPKKLLTAKEIANQNLAIRFGWVPLIKDMNDIMDLADSIHRRKNELDRLYSGRGLRRRIKLGESVNNDSFSGSMSYNVHTSPYTASRITTARKWGVCHWKPSTIPALWPNEAARLKQATLAVSGMTTAGLFDGAWDLLPWTFIIDWFTDFRSFVLAHNNTVPAQYIPGVIMTHLRSESQVQVQLAAGYSGGGGTVVTESKLRTLSPVANVNAFLPNLGQDRLSILSSLFIQRFKR